MAFENFSGPNIDIVIRAQDKFSTPLKKIAKNTQVLNSAADEMSSKITTSSRNMTKELNFFENNTNKALKKASKLFSNFGGFAGGVLEDFGLGFGIAAGAVGIAASMIIKNTREQDEAFL